MWWALIGFMIAGEKTGDYQKYVPINQLWVRCRQGVFFLSDKIIRTAILSGKQPQAS